MHFIQLLTWFHAHRRMRRRLRKGTGMHTLFAMKHVCSEFVPVHFSLCSANVGQKHERYLTVVSYAARRCEASTAEMSLSWFAASP